MRLPFRTAALLVLAASPALFATSGVAPPGSPAHAAGGPAPAPNVLVVVTDDQRADATAVMPRTREWLAEGGTTFPEAYVTTPLCCPSRSSILSGRYAHNHGVRTNGEGAVLDQDSTLPARLARAGYRSAISGKFLLFWDLDRPPPHFDRYAITNGTQYHGDEFAVDGQRRSVPEYSTSFIGERALEYLDDFEVDDDRPWFLYVAPQAAHSPYVAEDRYAASAVPAWRPGPGVSEADRSDKPPFVRDYHFTADKAAGLRSAQLRTLRSVDDLMAALERRLVDLDEERDTLVVFTSDNGYMWGEHGLRSKSLPYTESIRVPFLVRWPGRIPSGKRDSRLVSTADIAPTVLAAAGIDPAPSDPRFDGRSLLGPSSRRRTRLLVEYAEDPFFPYPTWAVLRGRDFQYVEYYDREGGADAARVTFNEFYDLRTDAAQLENLLGDGDPANDPPGIPQLSADLARARRCAGTTCP